MVGGVGLTLLYTFSFFLMLQSRSTLLIWLVIIIGLPILKDAIFGPMATLVSEMFNSNVRYSGVSAVREIGTAVFGDTAPHWDDADQCGNRSGLAAGRL